MNCNKKCTKCNLYMKMYSPNPEDPEKPKEEWDCAIKWMVIVMSEVSGKLGALIRMQQPQKEGEQK